MSRSRLLALVLAALAVIAFAGLGMRGTSSASDRAGRPADRRPPRRDPAGAPAASGPNVVLILTDDLDKSLMPYMPNVTRLIRDQGAELTNFYVEQSSCCPSRASILSGLYAHNHGVIGNVAPRAATTAGRRPSRTTTCRSGSSGSGYRSAMLGKYFNEYPYHPGSHLSDAEKPRLRSYVPPGWQSWAAPVQGNAYAQDHYKINVDGDVDAAFHDDYLDTWLGDRALSLVDGADGFDFAGGGQFLYYASYSPHTPYAYPPELEGSFADVQYPRTPDFDEADVSDKFGLTRTRRAADHHRPRDDRRDVPQADPLGAGARPDRRPCWSQELRAQGALDNTYLIFTSDNGYIMGNHRREIGKYNQFQGTVNVPFYVRGPGIAPGSTYDDVAGQHRHRADHRRDRRRQRAGRTWTASRCCRGCRAGRRSTGATSCSAGR